VRASLPELGIKGQVVWLTIFGLLCNVIERSGQFRDLIGFFGPNYDRRSSENAVYVTRVDHCD
jgi:hypothetical protein